MTIPATPMIAAARRSALPFLRLRSVPITAVGMITAAEVPLATTGGMPNSRIIAGTITIPPPTPSSPARMPVASPTTSSAATVIGVTAPRPSASVEMNRRIAEMMRIAEKSNPNVRWGRTCSSLVPMTAPATAPMASHRATLQSTLSWVA